MLFLIYCMVCFKFASHWTQQEPHKHHCIHQNDPALTRHRSNMFDHVWSCLLQNCFKHISKYFQNHFKIISNTFLNLFNIIFLSLSFWHFLAHSSSFNSPHCPLWPAKVLANQVGTDRSAKSSEQIENNEYAMCMLSHSHVWLLIQIITNQLCRHMACVNIV